MSLLHNPHPPIEAVHPSTFDYSAYPFEHCTAVLGGVGGGEHTASATGGPLAPGVLLITLNRPQQLNAFTNQQCHSLVFLFELADRDDRVKVVVLTGAGKAFCAGADLNGGGGDDRFGVSASLSSPLTRHRDGGGQLVLAILSCRKLVLAAINGVAVGIGLTMTLPADIRICSQDARVGVPFVKRGIACDAVSSYLLPRIIGWSRASRLLLTGDLVKASDRCVEELFYSLHPPEEVLPQALKLAARLSKENSIVSIALCKSQLWRGASTPEEVHLQESKALAWCALHGDAEEGVQSFLQKRPANFSKTLADLGNHGWFPWWASADVKEGCRRGGQSKL